jgi:hypothetical protein
MHAEIDSVEEAKALIDRTKDQDMKTISADDYGKLRLLALQRNR